ncbi:unnamed protein product [Cylicocyclus nassatus]|uniref:Uncharacterized protein n=1 Tax=Cylicocyclus nassatus TaxID=53992 RepID=A0AA36GP78_CYLNA|nr:unnamed protein product [Cylicocyclus nassatus]
MPAVNEVAAVRSNQDFIDKDREINMLRRKLNAAERERDEFKKSAEELTEKLSNERWTSRAKQAWLKRSMEDMALLEAANNALSKAMSTLRRNIGDGINS